MNEKQQFSNFLVVSALILCVWLFVGPQLFPPPPKPAPAAGVKKDAPAVDKPAEKVEDDPKAKPGKLHEFPKRDDVVIGSSKLDSGYRMLVKFDSLGATVSQIQLIDPRYHDLEKPKEPLSLIQPDPAAIHKTLEIEVPAVDDQLKKFKTSLQQVNWEVVKGEQTDGSVTWR